MRCHHQVPEHRHAFREQRARCSCDMGGEEARTGPSVPTGVKPDRRVPWGANVKVWWSTGCLGSVTQDPLIPSAGCSQEGHHQVTAENLLQHRSASQSHHCTGLGKDLETFLIDGTDVGAQEAPWQPYATLHISDSRWKRNIPWLPC